MAKRSPTYALPREQAVKRERGKSVLELRREAEAEAQREQRLVTKPLTRKRDVSTPKDRKTARKTVELADPTLPNGVGIQGRGRAIMNGKLDAGRSGLEAQAGRERTLIGKAEFRPARGLIKC